MALPKIISILAPKIFKVIKNLKSKAGGEGKFNLKLLGQDIAIDLTVIAGASIIIIIFLAVLGIISWETLEKAIPYLENLK